jgi:hypothetical protein
MPAIAERPRREGHICVFARYEHGVASENVDEFPACCGRLVVLCLLTPRVIVTQKRGLSNDFKGIPDIQMWQTISQSRVGQTQEFHVVVPIGGVQLLQRLVEGVRRLCLLRGSSVQSLSRREPLLHILLLVERIARVFRGLDLVRERERKRGDVREVGLGSGDARATLYGRSVGQGVLESRDRWSGGIRGEVVDEKFGGRGKGKGRNGVPCE